MESIYREYRKYYDDNGNYIGQGGLSQKRLKGSNTKESTKGIELPSEVWKLIL